MFNLKSYFFLFQISQKEEKFVLTFHKEDFHKKRFFWEETS